MKLHLIDRVTEVKEDSLQAIRCVTAGEEYLQDHFPGFPILPGVFQLEALVQAARAWIERQPDAPVANMVIQQVRNIKYADMVQPGDTLRIEVTCRKRDGDQFDFQGQAFNGDSLAVSGRFTLVPLVSE